MTPQSTRLPYLLILFLCFGAYGAMVTLCAVDIPFWDDFDSILGRVVSYQRTESFLDTLRVLIARHNEHRIGFSTGCTVLVLHILGRLDFQVLTYAGNVGLLVVWWAVCKLASDRESALPKLYVPALAALLLFNPQFYDTVIWPTVLLSNFWAAAWIGISLIALEKRGWFGVAFGAVASLLGLFSLGNGILAFPIGFCLLAYQRRKAEGAVWLLVSAAALSVYFLDFQLPPSGARKGLLQMADHGLGFLGAAPAFGSYRLAELAGAAQVLILCWITWKGYYRKHPGFYGFILFLFLTAGLNCLGRAEHGVGYVLVQPRYRFVSLLAAACTTAAWMQSLKPRTAARLSVPVIVGAFCVWIGSYLAYADNVFENRDILLRSAARWEVSKSGLYYPVEDAAAAKLREAEAAGIYKLGVPQASALLCSPARSADPRESSGTEVQGNVDILASNDEFIFIDGWAAIRGAESLTQTVTIVLAEADVQFQCNARTIVRPDVRSALSNYRLLRSGFSALIPWKDLPGQEYSVIIRVHSGAETRDWSSGKRVSLPPKAQKADTASAD